MLSDPLEMVAYLMSCETPMRLTWASNPVCSKSLFVVDPLGLSVETRSFCTSSGKG